MDKKSVVSVVRCWDYNEQKVEDAVRKAVDLIGGLDEKATSGKRILLKPNCLDASKPEKGVTTHPSVFKAIGKILKEYGADCCYGDSPAIDSPAKALKVCGIEKAAVELGINASDFFTPVEIVNQKSKLIKKFVIAKAFTNVDFVVSLPKLKTHGQTYFTGAVKNIFGMVPGLRKAAYHFKLPGTELFSQMLVDLYSLINPIFSLMDGIVGMDGNGPKSGRLRDVGLVIMGLDGVSVDAVSCKIIGINPMEVPTIRLANEQGVGVGDLDNIEIRGENTQEVKVKYFDVYKPAPDMKFLGDYLSQKVKHIITLRPVIDNRRCNSCYTCVNICPPTQKALSIVEKEKPPSINHKFCIRCYCCQEVCPKGAIRLIRNPIVGLFITIYKWIPKVFTSIILLKKHK
ncbi:MAG: DUF362 domain-containing protein [bacterium]